MFADITGVFLLSALILCTGVSEPGFSADARSAGSTAGAAERRRHGTAGATGAALLRRAWLVQCRRRRWQAGRVGSGQAPGGWQQARMPCLKQQQQHGSSRLLGVQGEGRPRDPSSGLAAVSVDFQCHSLVARARATGRVNEHRWPALAGLLLSAMPVMKASSMPFHQGVRVWG
jgi:hypothetical protein